MGRGRRPSRRGSAYVLVLVSTTLVLGVAGAAIALNRASLGRVRIQGQGQRAAHDAQSSLEWIMSVLRDDPNGLGWRDSATRTLNYTGLFGQAGTSCTVTLTDPNDGDLRGATSDSVLVGVSAVSGPARQAFALRMDPVLSPMDCLDYAVIAATGSLDMGGTLYADGPVSTATPRKISQGEYTPIEDATPLASGTQTQAVQTEGEVQVVEPTPPAGVLIPDESIFALYASRGAMIDISTLPGGEIDHQSLGPGRNPYGATSASGVYIIDCHGQIFRLRRSRIVGTLVILDPGAGSRIEDGVSIEPASADSPALLVRGALEFRQVSTDLSEADEVTNFNPTGVPGIAGAASDTDQADRYPSYLKGVVFIAGHCKVAAPTTIEGTLIVDGSLLLEANLMVRHRKPEEIIPGFFEVTGITMEEGSLARVVE